MVDYAKWDKLDADSEEEPEIRKPLAASFDEEDHERSRGLQEEVNQWLKREIMTLRKGPEGSSVPELKRQEPLPYRKVTKQEREVLAMLIAVSHFEEGQTNLTRHPELLELVRHHRWLEEDPGTLELLCRIHNDVMRRSGERHAPKESPHDVRMRNMLLSGINTLASPKRAECSGGLLELITRICTPENEAARDLRKKWQKKEFAKDALFDSLFPDLRNYAKEDSSNESMLEIWVFVILIVLLVGGIALFFVFGPSLSSSGQASTTPPPGAMPKDLPPGAEEL